VSAGAIAMTAILVSGAEVTGLIIAGTVLVYTKRIVLAATPKPAQQQSGATAGQSPAGTAGAP
jgi:hypothetical protein